MKNDCYILNLYKLGACWVFDDERFGLKQEPFVGAANEVIDSILKSKGIKSKKFSAIFSRFALPEFDACFDLEKVEGKSAWYNYWGKPFWLCPCINNYFEKIPTHIYVKIL